MPNPHPQAPEPFIEAIRKVQEVSETPIAKAIESIQCFGWLWKDETGICTEMDCILRKKCEAVYNEVTASWPQEQIPTALSVMVEDLKKDEEIYKKINDLGRYKRVGYYYHGRPVDNYTQRLVHCLGYPQALPTSWSAKNFNALHKDKARLIMSQTASYHAFYVDGNLVLRMWTNTPSACLCDLGPILTAKAKVVGKPLLPIPPGSKKKLGICESRMYCSSEQDAEELANWIIELYKLEIK